MKGIPDATQTEVNNETSPRNECHIRLLGLALLLSSGTLFARPGGFNGADGFEVDQPTDEQEASTNYELGIKSTLWDGRVVACSMATKPPPPTSPAAAISMATPSH